MKLFCGVVFLSAALLTPLFAASSSARLLTVDLFSAHAFDSITLTPLGSESWMRACGTCKKQMVTAPVHVTVKGGMLETAAGTHAASLKFEGAFRAQAGDATGGIMASGLWEVKHAGHRLHLLLTMPSERYVALALNGEAAPDEPLESLKAMAIVMRTYALTNAARHAAEGFNLCDSTHCQALRFGRIRPEIEEAVLETSGETLWYGPQRATVFYTQDCGGKTEDAGSVWTGAQTPYLKSHADPYCLRRSAAEWQCQIPERRIQAIARHEGWHLPQHIEHVRVIRSTASGRASLLEVEGAGRRAVLSASSLRFAIDRALGWNQLRSDWYTVTVSNGDLRFAGRGYGHGVGLCQAGAYEMASQGQSSRAILGFYFPGTEVRIGPTGDGWHKMEGKGWTLLATTPAPALLRAGNAAWGEAQALFPPLTPVHPVVRMMPTTELFRQATNQPGWILATAKGAAVFLQPQAVLARTGGESATLRHEFLHVLVEEEARSRSPLWLREGLVEALGAMSHPSHDALPALDVAKVDAALAHPEDQAASQRAHALSEVIVTRLIARFGISSVRGWLTSGVPPQVLGAIAQLP